MNDIVLYMTCIVHDESKTLLYEDIEVVNFVQKVVASELMSKLVGTSAASTTKFPFLKSKSNKSIVKVAEFLLHVLMG